MTQVTTPDTIVRLYVSPLDAASLSRVVPPAKQSQICYASYHTLPTFPDKPFAYLELPAELSKEIKRRLNGSFLRGVKMRVEEARPEKRKRKTAAEEEAAETKAVEKEERRSKRKRGSKPEEGVQKAIELPDGRKVKRGRADADGKKEKSKNKAKASEDTALVFRTSVPPNAVANGHATETSQSKKNKSRRGEKAIADVKEGDKSSKFPTFVRSDSSNTAARAAEFVEGKGWVDEDGHVVEAVVKQSRARKSKPDQKPQQAVAEVPTKELTPSDTSASNDENDADPAVHEPEDTPAQAEPDAPSSLRSRSGSAHPINSTEIHITESERPAPSALEALFKRPAGPSRQSRSTRSKPAPAQTFSFFSAERASTDPDSSLPDDSLASQNADSPETTTTMTVLAATDASPEKAGKKRPSNLLIPPQTPFTRRDIDSRAMRSAAPTPDTAAIGRRFRPWAREGSAASSAAASGSREPSVPPTSAAVAEAKAIDDEEDEDDDDDEEDADVEDPEVKHKEDMPVAKSVKESEDDDGGEGDGEQNEFEKHFYEQRGEYNRSWKARKREAKKGARQAENRRGLRGKG